MKAKARRGYLGNRSAPTKKSGGPARMPALRRKIKRHDVCGTRLPQKGKSTCGFRVLEAANCLHQLHTGAPTQVVTLELATVETLQI
jgi:hypothetical protein